MNTNNRDIIAAYIKAHPENTYVELAKIFHCCKETIYNVAAEFDIHRRPGRRSNLYVPDYILAQKAGE